MSREQQGHDVDQRVPGSTGGASSVEVVPGKRTVTEQLQSTYVGPPAQRPLGPGKRTRVESLQAGMQASGPAAAVQASPASKPSTPGHDHEIAPATPGIDKVGFIDNSEGSFLRTGPRELGGAPVRSEPLPPATRVFVSGTHPQAPAWWYVTAFLDETMVRGYVQHGRVNTDLPEPTAKLHQVVSGDTAEKLAVQEYKSSVRDGHDLRYYENMLLYVNQHDKIPRAGIAGSYQDPGALGGGSNNVQLVAGHRIWLVRPAYAKALEGVVPMVRSLAAPSRRPSGSPPISKTSSGASPNLGTISARLPASTPRRSAITFRRSLASWRPSSWPRRRQRSSQRRPRGWGRSSPS
jgi:hypothetical protein